MNIKLTDEQINAQNKFRAFIDEHVIPFADKWDEEEIFPKDAVVKLAPDFRKSCKQEALKSMLSMLKPNYISK